MIALIGIPVDLFYSVLMHFIFGNFKNSYLRTIVDFVAYKEMEEFIEAWDIINGNIQKVWRK